MTRTAENVDWTLSVGVLNGKLHIGSVEYEIPNVFLSGVVGKGANGIVMSGEHTFLERRVAVKIWIKLRQRDKRNKYYQGIREANKAARIESTNAVKIFDVGMVGGNLYAVMEFIEGITCRQWLDDCAPNLLTRMMLALALANEIFLFHFQGIVHGDLHTNNIIIRKPFSPMTVNGIFKPSFCIIDFGTSYFAPEGFSEARHWTVFSKTLNILASPFDLEMFGLPRIPRADENLDKLFSLYASYDLFFDWIGEILQSFEMNMRQDPTDISKWQRAPKEYSPYFHHERFGEQLRRLRSTGKLELTPEFMGVRDRNDSRPLRYLFEDCLSRDAISNAIRKSNHWVKQ